MTNWIETLERKRSAQYSTTVVVETNDDKRFFEYLQHTLELNLVDTDYNWYIYVYDTFFGLNVYEPGYEDVSEARPKAVGGGSSPSDPFGIGGGPIEIINDILEPDRSDGNKRIDYKRNIVIIKNVIQRADDNLQKALNVWATHDSIFGNCDVIVIFTPVKTFIEQTVLNKCIDIEPPLSEPEERSFKFDEVLDKIKVSVRPEDRAEIVALTGGLDLNQTEAVYVETLSDFARTNVIDHGLVARTKADLINKTGILKVRSQVKLGFERVGGYQILKDLITNSIIRPIKDSERARELGLEMPRGMILFGPGGTGKTILAMALAKELAFPFVELSPENYMSSYVGESERNLRQAIKIIEDMAPCLVFIDESHYGSTWSHSHPFYGTVMAVKLTDWAEGGRHPRAMVALPDGCSHNS